MALVLVQVLQLLGRRRRRCQRLRLWPLRLLRLRRLWVLRGVFTGV